MRERRYGSDNRIRDRGRGRSPSSRRPPPSSREFNPSKNREYSPHYRHVNDRYLREPERSQRTDRSEHFDRDTNLQGRRFSEYDDRVAEGRIAGGRHSRSPQRRNGDRDRYLTNTRVSISPCRRNGDTDRYRTNSRRSISPWRREKSGHFARDIDLRGERLYDDGGKAIDGSRFGFGHSSVLYGEQSRRRESSLTKFGLDHLSGGRRKSDLSVKGYNYASDYYRAGETNATRGVGERDYFPQSQYLDRGQSGLSSFSQYLNDTEPISFEYVRDGKMNADSYTFGDGGIGDLPKRSLAGGEGSSHTLPVTSRYLNNGIEQPRNLHFRDELPLEKRGGTVDAPGRRYVEKKDGEFHFGGDLNVDKLGMGKSLRREQYQKDDNLLSSPGYLKGDLGYVVSSSRSKNYVPVSSSILGQSVPGYSPTGKVHISSHMNLTGTGLTSEPNLSAGEYSGKADNILSGGSGSHLIVGRSHSRSYIEIAEENDGNRLYSDYGRHRIEDGSRTPKDVNEGYMDQHISGIGFVDPMLGESFRQNNMADEGLSDPYASSLRWTTPDKLDSYRSSRARNRELDILGTGHSHHRRESVEPVKHHAQLDDGTLFRDERSGPLESRENDRSFGRLYDDPRRVSPSPHLRFVEDADRRLKRKYEGDHTIFPHDVGISISTDGNGVRKIYHRAFGDGEDDLVNLSKKPNLGKSNYKKRWMSREIPSSSSSKFIPRNSSNSNRTGSRDIKKRLGPVPRKLHVSQRLVKKHKPSVKKHLAPAPGKKYATLPWIKNLNSNRMPPMDDDSYENPQIQNEELLVDHPPLPRPEPSEKSEDFKQLLQSAFFKFLKQINEMPAQRKKYVQQGKAGSLKCIVCGSNSDEYVDTESLIMHAFSCEKVGLRSQHLGLHKALCLLMGWRSTERLNDEWHRDVLPIDEAAALKEDLIIWPPVVIINNSTIDSINPDERVILSTEELDTKLRGMGFRTILKVCNGKPANQSVMVVKFNGTLSGLQEADRLHKSYAERHHGRNEYKELKSCKNGSSHVDAQVLGSREERFLYGHLGIAEDLDKLDFDAKKRSVIKSRKELLSIVDAAAGTE